MIIGIIIGRFIGIISRIIGITSINGSPPTSDPSSESSPRNNE